MRRTHRRAGTTLLEILVAMVVLAIALAGLCPMMVMQMKLLRRIESQPIAANPQVIRGVRMVDGHIYVPAGQPYVPAGQPHVLEGQIKLPPMTVLRPQQNDWVRRLGVAATFQTIEVTPRPDPDPVLTESKRDDLDDGVDLSGHWTPRTSEEGYACHELGAGNHDDSATWRFSPIGAGRYRVMISWPPSIPIPDDAAIAVNGGPPVVIAGQATPLADGSWHDLGNHSLGSSLELRLGGSDLGTVVADAVRIGARNRVTILSAGDAGVRVKVETSP